MSDFDEKIEALKKELYEKVYEIGKEVRKTELTITSRGEFLDWKIRYCDLITEAFKDAYFDLPKKEQEH